VLLTTAQSNYTEAVQQGDAAFKKGEYKTAINKYFAAEAFDPTKKEAVKGKVNVVFDKIETLYLRNLGLSTLPASVYLHKNLKRLVLKNRDDAETYRTSPFNNFSIEEQEKTRKRLPGCEVEF